MSALLPQTGMSALLPQTSSPRRVSFATSNLAGGGPEAEMSAQTRRQRSRSAAANVCAAKKYLRAQRFLLYFLLSPFPFLLLTCSTVHLLSLAWCPWCPGVE